MSQRILAAAASAVLALGLVGCGNDDDGPATTPPPTVGTGQSDDGGAEQSDGGGAASSDGGGGSEEATDAASSVPAPDPADYPGMDEETPEGAEQAFSYFWDVAITGFQGGDHAQLDAMSSADCKNCDALIQQIENLDERGEHWSVVETTPVDLDAKHGEGKYAYIATYSFVIPAHTEPPEHGAEPVKWEEITYESTGGLVWESGAWKVADFSSDYSEGAKE